MHCKCFEQIPCFFSGIFSTTIEYGTSSSSIDSSNLFIWVFSHLICGCLVGASNAIRFSCNRQGAFSLEHDNEKKNTSNKL